MVVPVYFAASFDDIHFIFNKCNQNTDQTLDDDDNVDDDPDQDDDGNNDGQGHSRPNQKASDVLASIFNNRPKNDGSD